MSTENSVKTRALVAPLRVLTALLVLWLTGGDVLLRAVDVLPDICRRDAAIRLWYVEVTTLPACVWWTLLQLGRWKLTMVRRWQTYVGWMIVVLGTFPACRMVSAAYKLVASGVSTSWLVWLADFALIGLVLVGKVAIWVYWWRITRVTD